LAANAGNNLTYEWFRNGSSIRKGPERFLEVSQAASYTVRVTAPGCEAVSAPVTVRNSPLFADIAQKGKLLVCDSKGVALTANTGIGYTYQWLLNGNILPAATQPQHQAAQTGLYQVRISYRGCTALSPVTQVEVMPVLASLNPADRAAICNGAPAILNAPQQSSFAYSWYYNGASIPGANKSSYPATNPGRYAVEVRNGSCQVRSSEVVVQRVSVTATLTPPPTTLIPPGGSLPLKASYAIGNRYTWYRNDSLMPQEITPLLVATRGGTYRVKIDNSGCRVNTESITLWGGQDTDPLLTEHSLPLDSLSSLVLYPNPAQETLILTMRLFKGGTADLRADLLTVGGQTLASQPLLPERDYFRSQFDLKALPPGAYLIKVKAGVQSGTRHFIKR
ncbi:MAG: T9SS type A sorting domain-containing protein, partial [Bacteroidetes bacterium]|nr:T9SS type A sorting domain-containing protein [Bacteroidota bacterium]